MKLEQFTEYVRRLEIPPEAPEDLLIEYWRRGFNVDVYMKSVKARSLCINRGMWAIVDMTWTKELAKWIGNRLVLEIMSGFGWLAKALHEHGVGVLPTDNFEWADDTENPNYKNCELIFPVENRSASWAVRRYTEAEVLLVSWPPYKSNAICRACEVWGKDRPIIYIGEGDQGCCAPREFFTHFEEIDKQPKIAFPHWDCLHDGFAIGYYNV